MADPRPDREKPPGKSRTGKKAKAGSGQPSGATEKSRRKRREDTSLSLFPDLPERIQIERSVSTMGFFSVKSGIPADGNLERTIKVSRTTEEGRVEGKATIAALKATGGFCGIEEQDVYYAILSAVTEAIALGDEIPVPIAFAPGELLRRMGKSDSGFNYAALAQQLKRLAGTTVVSQKSLYRVATGSLENSDEVFRIIDRLIIKGETLADGTVSNEHLIWLSPWQKENLEGNHRLIVDYQRYLLLSKPIARAIVPYLQLWLFASRKDGKGSCERLYDQLCGLLGITVETIPSRIRSQFGPSCQELKDAGYIRDWEVKQLAGLVKKRYKLVFYHGPAFGPDVEVLEPAPMPPKSEDVLSDDEKIAYVQTLLSAGIWNREAHKLARGLTRVTLTRALRIVEYVRGLESEGKVENSSAFLAQLLRQDRIEPVVITAKSAKRRPGRDPGSSLPEDQDAEIQRNAMAELEAQREYEGVTDEISKTLSASERAEIYAAAVELMFVEYPHAARWGPKLQESQIAIISRRIVRQRYP